MARSASFRVLEDVVAGVADMGAFQSRYELPIEVPETWFLSQKHSCLAECVEFAKIYSYQGVRMTTLRILAGGLLLIFPLLLSAQSSSESAATIKSSEELMREQMIVISRQLGVTCITCHNTDNFKSDRKDTFKIAKEHMKLTQLLIDSGMNGKGSAKADCYMCHRGQLKPAYQEKVSKK